MCQPVARPKPGRHICSEEEIFLHESCEPIYRDRAINSILERAQKSPADDKVWQKEQRQYQKLMLKAKAAYREDLETSSQETGDGH